MPVLIACITTATLLFQITDPPPRVERLSNGLRVVVVPDRTQPLISVQLWYAVGSAFDDPSNPGLCHIARTILERRNEAAPRLRAAGARFESRTLRDACYFSSVLPPHSLEQVLKIEAERMQPLSTTPEMVASARAAAVTPDDQRRDADRRLLAAMFPQHPYAHPPGFVAESLARLTPGDVDTFLQRWFVPGNATLLIIGDVSDVKAMDLVRRHFGQLPWAESPRRAALPDLEAEQLHLPPAPADRTGLEVAWLTPPAGYFENAAIDVLMHRLCNPVDGPLYLRLTELGYPPPRWHRDAWREHGLLTLSVDCPAVAADVPSAVEGDKTPPAPTDPPPSIERTIKSELEKATTTIPTEIEFNRARALAARDVMLARASFPDRAGRLAWHELIAGDVLLAAYESPRVATLAVADLQQAAAELLAARTVWLPRRAQPSQAQELPAPKTPPSDPPAPVGVVSIFELPNGVGVTVRTITGQDCADVRTLASPSEGVYAAMQAAMATGSTRHSVTDLRDYLSYHALDMYPCRNQVGGGLRSRGPATKTAQLIELQAELLRHADRRDSTLRAACQHGRDLHQWLRTAPSRSGNEIYLPPDFIGWLADTPPLTDVDHLRKALECLVGIRDIRVVVVGDVRPADVLEAVRDVWGDWTPAGGDASRTSRPADSP